MHPVKATLHSTKSIRQKISRQRFLCRMLFIGHPAKALPSANPAPGKEKWSLRRRLRHPLLCRVPCQRHPANIFLIFFQIFFAGCRAGRHPAKSFLFFFVISLPGARSWGTRQRIFFLKKLCRVPGPGHPAKFFFKSLPDAPWPGTRQRNYEKK